MTPEQHAAITAEHGAERADLLAADEALHALRLLDRRRYRAAAKTETRLALDDARVHLAALVPLLVDQARAATARRAEDELQRARAAHHGATPELEPEAAADTQDAAD